ncbi:MAG: hypothetical protein AAF806_02310 [Bacteroidota bacterium]
MSFKQYFNAKQNARSISHLIIDEEQRIWCQNFVGQIFYVESDSLYLFEDSSKQTGSFPQYAVRGNELLVGLGAQLYHFDIGKGKEA